MASRDEINSVIAALRGEGLGDLADEVSKSIEKNEKLTNRQMKQLEKYRKQTNSTLNGLMKDYKKYIDGREALAEVDEVDKKMLEEKIKHHEKLSNGISRVTERQTGLERVTRDLTETRSRSLTTMRQIIDSLNEEVTVVGLLDTALRGLESLYDTWFSVQTELTRAMGQAAMATGGTAQQLSSLQGEASGLRDLMFELNGSTIGWADSMRVVTDASMALRMDSQRMSESLGENPLMQILGAERGLGLGAQQVAQLFRTLQTGIDGGNESIGEFTINIREFADSIGANASQISQEFIDSRDALQRFGADGSEVFRRVATYANHFGFETRRVLDMAARFDRFGQASENINQLNAMFGTTISSFELMQERDPIRRIETITNAIREQGIEWGQMDFAQQQTIADSLGVSTSEAARLVQGESMEEITRQREAEQQEQERFQQRQLAVQETLMGIVEQTSTYFQRASDYIELIRIDVSQALGPIFEAIRDVVMESNIGFREWVRSIVGSTQFRETVQNIADWIRALPGYIEEFMPTWDEVSSTAKEIWPVIDSIGDGIMSMIQYVIDHKDEFIGAFERAWSAGERIITAVGQIRDGFLAVVDAAISSYQPFFRLYEVARDIAEALGFGGEITQPPPTSPESPGIVSRILNEGPAAVANLGGDVANIGGDASSTVVGGVESIFSLAQRGFSSALSQLDSTQSQIMGFLNSGNDVQTIPQSVEQTTIQPPTATSSATVSAPAASQTVTLSERNPTSPRDSQIGIAVSDVNINGERLGQIFFQISRR